MEYVSEDFHLSAIEEIAQWVIERRHNRGTKEIRFNKTVENPADCNSADASYSVRLFQYASTTEDKIPVSLTTGNAGDWVEEDITLRYKMLCSKPK